MILNKENLNNETLFKNSVIEIKNIPNSDNLLVTKFLLYVFVMYTENLKYIAQNNKNESVEIDISNFILQFDKYINIKKIISKINNIQIVYFRKYKEKKSDYIFNTIKYNQNTKLLKFKLSNYFKTKLNYSGKGHKIAYIPFSIFRDRFDYRHRSENKKDFYKQLITAASETY